MSASHDKVQSILQTVLQNNLPLIHKGIFTQQQLQHAMHQRQKLQNNMFKPTFKLSDYLKSIQFQYTLQRIRRSRMKSSFPSNTLFKKQTKTDFVIIKRIINLWNRTMHKFKFDIELWKQYLDFCIKIQSKKQFYKALSTSLRFLPFAEVLWLIGVRYEIQIGCNLWKARKIFIKALKINYKSVHLWTQMFKFQIYFLKILSQREKAIQGNSTIEFIVENQDNNDKDEESQLDQQRNEDKEMMDLEEMNEEQKQVKLSEHSDILIMVYEQGLSSIEEANKITFKQTINEIVSNSIKTEKHKLVLGVLKKVRQRISVIQIEHINKIVINNQNTKQSIKIPTNLEEKLQHSKSYLTSNQSLTNPELDKIFCQFLTKPIYLSDLLSHFLKINSIRAISYLKNTNKIKIENLPPTLIYKLIQMLMSKQDTENVKLVFNIINKINTNSFIQYPNLMGIVIKFNKKHKNYKGNFDIHRSISILSKSKPEIIEKCLQYINQQK